MSSDHLLEYKIAQLVCSVKLATLAMSEFDEAHTYDNNSSEQKEDGVNLLSFLGLEKGSEVLDLGCGTGYLTKVIADTVGPTGKVKKFPRCVVAF